AVKELRELARERDVELWFSGYAAGLPAKQGDLPGPLQTFAPFLDVVVYLQPERDVVHLRLLKDHDHADLADLHLRLDPHTTRGADDVAPPPPAPPPDPRRYRLISGGNKGAEAEFGVAAERWGLCEVNFTFAGHRLLERQRGIVTLTEDELK